MKFTPQKRVGSPASFRGVRGAYLTSMLMFVGAGLFLILIVLIFPFSMIIRLIITLVIIAFLFYKFSELKKLSKGDLNRETKKNCRKRFVIKSK